VCKMVFAAALRLKDAGENAGVDACDADTQSATNSDYDKLASKYADASGQNLFPWMNDDEWKTIEDAIVKDKDKINQAAAVAGVEPQSETNWRYADDYKVPRVCFINKLDRLGASFEKSFRSILERLTPNAVRMQLPDGEEDKFQGVVNLLEMKYFTFEGEYGERMVEAPIPSEDLKKRAEVARAELVEKIVRWCILPDFNPLSSESTVRLYITHVIQSGAMIKLIKSGRNMQLNHILHTQKTSGTL